MCVDNNGSVMHREINRREKYLSLVMCDKLALSMVATTQQRPAKTEKGVLTAVVCVRRARFFVS